MMKKTRRASALLKAVSTFASLCLLSLPTFSAEETTWTGAGDGERWSDAANWSTGQLPGPNSSVRLGVGEMSKPTMMDLPFNSGKDYLTHTVVKSIAFTGEHPVTIQLHEDLHFPALPVLEYGIGSSAGFAGPTWDLAGRRLIFRSGGGFQDSLKGTFLGEFHFGASGGAIISRDTSGGKDGTLRFHFGEDPQRTAALQVAGEGVIARLNNNSVALVAMPFVSTLAEGSSISIEPGGHLQFLTAVRSPGQQRAGTILRCAGAIHISAGGTLRLTRTGARSDDLSEIGRDGAEGLAGVSLEITESGSILHQGTLLLEPMPLGRSEIELAGQWIVDSPAALIDSFQDATHGGTETKLTILGSGWLHAGEKPAALGFRVFSNATAENLEIICKGTISAGSTGLPGSNKPAHVGHLVLDHVNLDLTEGVCRIHLSGTDAGQYDRLQVQSGMIKLRAESLLEVHLINGFGPTSAFSLPVIEVASFDAASAVPEKLHVFRDGVADSDLAAKFSLQIKPGKIDLTFTP